MTDVTRPAISDPTTPDRHWRGHWRKRVHAGLRTATTLLLGSVLLHWAAQHWLPTTPRGAAPRWIDALALLAAVLVIAAAAGAGWQLTTSATPRHHD